MKGREYLLGVVLLGGLLGVLFWGLTSYEAVRSEHLAVEYAILTGEPRGSTGAREALTLRFIRNSALPDAERERLIAAFREHWALRHGETVFPMQAIAREIVGEPGDWFAIFIVAPKQVGRPEAITFTRKGLVGWWLGPVRKEVVRRR